MHDVFPENTKPAGLKLPLYCLFKHIFDKAYSKADQLIALGHDMAEVLQNKVYGVMGSKVSGITSKIIIIENWADIEGIKPQPMP